MGYIGSVGTSPICAVVSSKVFPDFVTHVVFIFFFNNFGNLHSVGMLNLDGSIFLILFNFSSVFNSLIYLYFFCRLCNCISYLVS